MVNIWIDWLKNMWMEWWWIYELIDRRIGEWSDGEYINWLMDEYVNGVMVNIWDWKNEYILGNGRKRYILYYYIIFILIEKRRIIHGRVNI